MAKPKYERILLKLSGETFGGERRYGIDPTALQHVALEVKKAKKHGIQIAVVAGGGNIFRGLAGASRGIDRTTGDYMGMLATIINALALQDALEQEGVTSRVQTAIEMKAVAEPFIRRRAIRHMQKGRVVILAGGTGNPYFTTDTTAALRAAEFGVDVIIKATKVDGIYDKDPAHHKDAKRFNKLSHMDILKSRLKVMDSTAASLCMDNDIPIVVLNLLKKGNIEKAVLGKKVGTLVANGEK